MTTSLYSRRNGGARGSTAGPTTTDRAADWRDRALCRTAPDRETFFPLGTTAPARAITDLAKSFCGFCPVRLACAQWALTENMEFGVWGGLDEDERRSIRRHHRAEITDPDRLRRFLDARRKPSMQDSLIETYLSRSAQEDDGHVRWLSSKATVSIRGRVLTPAQLAFEVGYGVRPEGPVKARCSRPRCVAAEHLADNRVRADLLRKFEQAA